MRSFSVILTDPDGNEMDISNRIDLGRLGTVSETIEERLTILSIADMDIRCADADGEVEFFLRHISPGDAFRVTVDRETTERRPKWERIFYGVISEPTSVSIDRKAKTISFQVFSTAKELEDFSAEDVQRTFSGETGSVTTGTKVVTLSNTTGLLPGDEITLEKQDDSETRIIDTVDSGTQVTTTEDWLVTFTDAQAELTTPFYRKKSIEFLLGELLDLASVTDREIDLGNDLSDLPMTTVAADSGLGAGTLTGVWNEGGELKVVASTDGRDTALNTRDGWTNESASTTTTGDWSTYTEDEPASLVTGSDNGRNGFDHDSGDLWTLDLRTVATPSDHLELWLQLNTVDQVQVDITSDDLNFGIEEYFCDFDPVTGDVWISYFIRNISAGNTSRFLKVWDGSVLTTLESAWGRGCRTLGPIGRVAAQNHAINSTWISALSRGDLRIYDPAGRTLEKTLTDEPYMMLTTMRVVGDLVVCLYRQEGETRLRGWTHADWTQALDYKVQDGYGTSYATVFTDTQDRKHYFFNIDRNLYVAAKYFAGVVTYADFEGMSVANAVADLALISASVFRMDEYRTAIFRGRGANRNFRDMAEREVETILSRRVQPLGRQYVRQVVVTGVDSLDEDIEVLSGKPGESSYRLEIDSPLINTDSLAGTLGSLYVGFFGKQRSHEMIECIEPAGGPFRPLEIVTVEGDRYVILNADLEVENTEQQLEVLSL